MELKDLVGMHKLTGVDEDARVVKGWTGDDESVNCFSFTLDEKTYSAIEDKDDGYRSNMKEIVVTDKLSNTFAPIRVLASMQDKGQYDSKYNDILELRDVKNGKIILSVGTNHEDSYYPSFIASWVPENASVNEGV
jgi:hypothetical protein